MKKLIILLIFLVFATTVFAAPAMEIANYENDILIEKGWIRRER